MAGTVVRLVIVRMGPVVILTMDNVYVSPVLQEIRYGIFLLIDKC